MHHAVRALQPSPTIMRIAIDYTTGIYPGAGVARYTRQLMAALAGIDSRNSYRLFYAATGLPRYRQLTVAVEGYRTQDVDELDMAAS